MNTHNALISASLLAGLAVFSACATAQDTGPSHDDTKHVNAWKAVTKGICVIRPTDGNTASGIVRFTQVGDSVKIEAEISGLTPGAKHGFHIHQYGDVSLGNGKSAGGHYNPGGHDHAGPDKKVRHAGDLGNVTADAKGNAKLSLTLDNLSVAGMTNPVVGRGMIVHAGTDDLKSQPTGAAGARIGYGVIGIAK
jgi:superoxide dismutase, Cu-Zn family